MEYIFSRKEVMHMISLMSDQELDTFTQAIDLPAPCRSQVLAFHRDPFFTRLCPQALPG